MINLFDHIDFTDYIIHYCADAKKRCNRFTFRLLAEKAGFSSRQVLYRVLHKETKLSMTQCVGLSKALNHTKREARYFSLIVAYAQHRAANERPEILKKAMEIKNAATEPQLIDKDRYSFYSRWYHSVIRALVGIGAINEDYTSLGSKLVPPITGVQAKRSIELLERIGFIKRDKNGKYRILTAKNIKTGNEFTRKEKNRYHREFMEIAHEILRDNSPITQKVSSTVLGISEETYDIICNEAEELKKKIRTLVENETEADRVFLFQSILVPLTEKVAER